MQRMEWDGRSCTEVTEHPRAQRLGGESTVNPEGREGPGHCHRQASPEGKGETATRRALSCRQHSPLVGEAERRDARTTRLLLWSLYALAHAFPQLPASSPSPHACHYQPSLHVALAAPL